MNHKAAEETLAVERYLLGDMTAPELDQFEEHLFSCPECAESVQAGAAFVDNARAVWGEAAGRAAKEPVRRTGSWKPAPWWKRFTVPAFAPALAALALVCVVAYQRLVMIPGLQAQLAAVTAPQSLPSYALHAATRAAPRVLVVPAGAQFFSVYFDVTVESPSGYHCAILDPSGSVRFTAHLPPRPEAGGTMTLLIARSRLEAGDYTLVVSTEAPGAVEIGRYPFQAVYK
jgi:anti-sigma factor RsiW